MSGNLKTQEFYVCFQKGHHRWVRFLKKDFGHVFVLMKQGSHWMRIDPLFDCVLYIQPVSVGYVKDLYGAKQVEPAFKINDPRSFLPQPNISIVRYVKTFDISDRLKLRLSMMSCVSLVKAVIGVKNRCVTPHGLFKWLLKNNGELLSEK